MIRWTICIATNPHRLVKFHELMAVLMPQVTKYKGQIEVLVFWNNFEFSLGFLRQSMLEDARGEYISHIDDDDMIPDDYCDAIFPLLDGVDYIGFQVKFIDDGVEKKPVYHSLAHDRWYDNDRGYFRGITHLNPLKTELARTSDFPIEYNIGEDAKWAKGVEAKTEHVIDREMYIYNHVPDDSVAYKNHYYNKTTPHDTPIRPRLKKYARFHPRSTPSADINH